MLHKLRSEMLFLKCSLKSLRKCKMPISSAATAVWGRQSGFYYDMHAWNLQYDYGVVVSILILVTPNICQHLTERKSSSRNEPTSENLQCEACNVTNSKTDILPCSCLWTYKDSRLHKGPPLTLRTIYCDWQNSTHFILITTVPNMWLVRNQYNIHQGYTKFPKI
jgi:hypothetical protein